METGDECCPGVLALLGFPVAILPRLYQLQAAAKNGLHLSLQHVHQPLFLLSLSMMRLVCLIPAIVPIFVPSVLVSVCALVYVFVLVSVCVLPILPLPLIFGILVVCPLFLQVNHIHIDPPIGMGILDVVLPLVLILGERVGQASTGMADVVSGEEGGIGLGDGEKGGGEGGVDLEDGGVVAVNDLGVEVGELLGVDEAVVYGLDVEVKTRHYLYGDVNIIIIIMSSSIIGNGGDYRVEIG